MSSDTENTALLHKPYQSTKVGEAHDAARNAIDIVDEHHGSSKNMKYARRAFLFFVAVSISASFRLKSKAEIASNDNLFTVVIDEEEDLFPLLQASADHVTDDIVTDRDASESRGKCLDENGTPVGLRGDLDIKPDSQFEGVSFKRTNGKECPCSFVQAECELADRQFPGAPDCSTLRIDGRDAALNGYPVVTVRHKLKLCNYNPGPNLIKLSALPKKVKTEFWYPIRGTNEKSFFVDKSFNNKLLGPGECVRAIGTKRVSTSRSKHFMRAILQGGQRPPFSDQLIPGAFCYAFAFNKIDFKYDYGFGECLVNTSLSCKLLNGQDCDDFINSLDYTCTPFRATFAAKACNNNERDIGIQVGSSNYKINTYRKKPDGSYITEKTPLPEEIKSGQCKTFTTTKIVDPCEKNFFQINLKGKLDNTNAPNGWVYIDKECKSYSHDQLPFINPDEKPSAAPSTSVNPTSSPTVSVQPTISKGKGKPPNKGTAKTVREGERTRRRTL